MDFCATFTSFWKVKVMDFKANEGKKIEIEVGGRVYKRHAVKTHFVEAGEDYIEFIEKYVSPIYEDGDLISLSEKVIALCQNRVIRREDIKIGFWANLLSKFASKPKLATGFASESIKVQYVINKVGLLKVLYASVVSAITKLFGIKGAFYKIIGQEISSLDCFDGYDYDYYKDIGIESPENPNGVCNEIKNKLGIDAIIVDANEMGQLLLGKSDGIPFSDDALLGMVRDNPAGNGTEGTPIVLIREKKPELEPIGA